MSDAETTALSEPIYSTFADDADYAELLEMFVETVPEKRQAVEDAFGAGDLDGVQTHAHQLKGAGGGYGFDGLTGVASELEDACETGDLDRIGPALDRVLGYLDRLSV